jgi:NAD(P)H-hydrate epimerase
VDAIVTPAEMGAIDAAAPEPVEVLIGRAGGAVARAALDLLGGSYGRRVVVVAGKGNNGNDGREAARRLTCRGVRCHVIDAADAPHVLPAADLVIDAAYGTGFTGTYHSPRPADPATPVLAVDIPSGSTAHRRGGRPSLVADVTVTFAAWKPGLLLADGAALAGAVRVADIGLDVSSATAHVVDDAAVRSWLPARPVDAHKWRSAVRLVAGSLGMTGAAHLGAAAALRAGDGYVRLSSPGADTDPGAPTECVITPMPSDGWAAALLEEGLDRFSSLAVGPGLGRDSGAVQQIRRVLTGASLPTVVDGDGLSALGASVAEVLAAVTPMPDPSCSPHDGEFATLTGSPPPPDRFAAVRSLAADVGAVVLLKGPTTLVADPTGTVLAVTSGDARLATAGTGDVLTGVVAAFLAAGLSAPRAAAAAAHLHGRAGALAWPRGLVASDLVALLPVVLSELQEA